MSTADERPANEAEQLRDILAEAGIGRYSRKMAELIACPWVTAEYATAHIANVARRREPVAYLIRRLLDGDPAPEMWLEQVVAEIAHASPAPSTSPDVAGQSDTATNDGDGRELQMWRNVLAELRDQMPRAAFDNWLSDSSGFVDGDELLVVVRNDSAVDWVENRLSRVVLSTFGVLCGHEAPARLRALTRAQWSERVEVWR